MKPIILLGLVAVAAVTLGMGSLTNVITLNVQDFGVGDETIDSPIDSAVVKFDIQATLGNLGFFKNYINDCIISSPEDIDAGSLIFCKLTDGNGDVISEGSKTVNPTLFAGNIITIPIDDINNALVQNVHDVLIVVQGPKI